MSHASPETDTSAEPVRKIPSPRMMSGQLTVLTILVAMVPLVCLGTLGYVFYDSAYRTNARAVLGKQAMSAAQSVNAFLEEKISNLRQEAGTAGFAQLSDPARLRDRLHMLQDAYQGVFLGLDVLDASGMIVADTGPTPAAADAPWFQQAISRPQFVSSLDMRDSQLFITVRVASGQAPWLLRAHLDPAQIDDRIRIFQPAGPGGSFFLDRHGAPDPSASGTSTRETTAILAGQVFPEGRPVVIEARDDRNEMRMYGCAPVKASGGILVIHQAMDDVLRPLVNARMLGLAIVLLGAAGIVATALALARRTEQRLLKAELTQQHMQRQLVEAGKLAAIGELAAGVAHEINNPLAIMMENAGWIEDLLASDDPYSVENVTEIRSSLQTITIQGHRCREITHKLLSFARKTDTTVRAVRVNPLLEDIAGFARQKAKYREAEIRLALDPDVQEVSGSPTELQQILLNLVNNAIDAIDRPGGLVELRSLREPDAVCITVSDNGQGIPADVLPRIFDPFFTTKAEGQGTGLGLAICRDILSKMNGTISVESTPGKGSAFRIRLPLRDEV
ncbi:ATP-binding protein [Desulfomicrobium salsuginis]